MSVAPPADRFEFWVRFVCGAVFGAVLGFVLWLHLFTSAIFGWAALPLGAIAFGLVAAWWGDRFWHFVLGLFRWW